MPKGFFDFEEPKVEFHPPLLDLTFLEPGGLLCGSGLGRWDLQRAQAVLHECWHPAPHVCFICDVLGLHPPPWQKV